MTLWYLCDNKKDMSKMDLVNKRFDVNTTYTINKIINRIKGDSEEDNKIEIPEYQRDFVWKEGRHIPELLVSLYIGYPIGIITVWDKNRTGRGF